MPQEDYTGYENQTGQEQNTDQAGGQEPAGHGENQSQQRMVPLEVVQSIRDENKEWKERARKLEQYIAQQQQHQQAQQQQQNDPLSDLQDEDFLTAGQARKLLQQQAEQTQQVLRETQMRQKFSDYDEIVSEHLPKLIEEKPHLREEILNSRDPYALAYEIGSYYKQLNELKQQSESAQEASAQAATETDSQLSHALQQNQSKPGTVSQAQASTQGGTSPSSLYESMSVDDFDNEIRKAKRGM